MTTTVCDSRRLGPSDPPDAEVDWLLPHMRRAEAEAMEGGLCSDWLLRDLAHAVLKALRQQHYELVVRKPI